MVTKKESLILPLVKNSLKIHCANWHNSKQLYKTKIYHEHNHQIRIYVSQKKCPDFKKYYFILNFPPICHFTSEMYVSTDEFRDLKVTLTKKQRVRHRGEANWIWRHIWVRVSSPARGGAVLTHNMTHPTLAANAAVVWRRNIGNHMAQVRKKQHTYRKNSSHWPKSSAKAPVKASIRVKWSINCWNTIWYFCGVYITGKAMKIQTPLEDRWLQQQKARKRSQLIFH